MFDEEAITRIPDSKLTHELEDEYERAADPDWTPDRKDAILDEIDRRLSAHETLELKIEDLNESLKDLKEQRDFDQTTIQNYYRQKSEKETKMEGINLGIEIAVRILRAANGSCDGGSSRN